MYPCNAAGVMNVNDLKLQVVLLDVILRHYDAKGYVPGGCLLNVYAVNAYQVIYLTE